MSRKDDHLVQAIDADSGLRVLAAVTTNLVHEAHVRHGTTPTTSAAFGRTLTGALLLGRTLKELDRLTIQIRCDGPIAGITAEASARGTVRGYVMNPTAEAPLNTIGKLDVRGIVGSGTMHAIHESGFELGLGKEPHYGSVPIVSGEIAQDFAYYLSVSEQINSVVALGVYVEPEESRVAAAGGYVVQVLPGARDETIGRLEEVSLAAPPVTSMILDGANGWDLVENTFRDFNFTLLEEMAVEFRCTCSRERAIQIVGALGEVEVNDMLERDKGAELTCHFCNEVYRLDEQDLERILMHTDIV